MGQQSHTLPFQGFAQHRFLQQAINTKLHSHTPLV
jgi:hypothetical protein